MTIDDIILYSSSESIMGTRKASYGTIHNFLWNAARAVQSRDISLLSKAYRDMLKLRADGTIELLATDTELEMIDFIANEYDKFQSGQMSAIKKGRGNPGDIKHHDVAISNEQLRTRVTDLEIKVNDLARKVEFLERKLGPTTD